MSNLLHSVLTSKLQQQEKLSDWENIHTSEDDDSDDDQLVDVRSAPATTPGTPANLSRPPSPPASAAPSSRSKLSAPPPTSSASGRRSTKKSKLDPLRAFSPEVNQRIFLQLPQNTLVSCSLVSKRWRRSATLNFCWYRLYQRTFGSLQHDSTLPAWGSGGARWTRRESKTDWKTSFTKSRRIADRDAERSPIGSGTSTPTRTQRMANAGIQTATEFRMNQWEQESNAAYSKAEMREYYKAGNKGGKVKGKTGRGGVKTGLAGDGGLWQ